MIFIWQTLELETLPFPDMASLLEEPITWMKVFFNVFDENLPTIEKMKYLPLDSTDFVKSYEGVQNVVDELGL